MEVNRLNWFLCSVVLFLSAISCSNTALLTAPPENGAEKYQQEVPDKWELSNGLTVYYLYDPEIPIVRAGLYLPGGSLWEPDDVHGAVEVMGQQMREGGAGNLDSEQLDLELEKLAATIATDYGAEFGTFSFSCLSSDLQRVMSLFRDVVREPRFQQDQLDLWKGQALEAIKRRRDDPNTVAATAFKQLLFEDSPLGEVLIENDVRKISRLDLLRMHRMFVRPMGGALAITGPIKKSEVEKLVQANFGDWFGSQSALADPPQIGHSAAPGIYFIELPFTQSTIYLGHIGPPRLTPDYIAIEGFNTIFGGGDFGSRLMKRIRTELGLVYGIYGGIVPGFPAGQAVMVLQTKSKTTASAIVESLDVLSGMKSGLIDNTEIDQARKSIQNSFIFRLDTPDDLVRRAVLLKLLNYPKDYDSTYLDKVQAMKSSEIGEVARKRWDPAKMVVVVVGNETAYNALEHDIASRPDRYVMGTTLRRCTFDQKLRNCS